MAISFQPEARACPISAEDVQPTRVPTEQAHTLPGRVYHDPAIHDWEVEQWFRRDWLLVGREEDAPEQGSFFRCEPAGEPLVVVRGNDRILRAFHNVCRHRGATLVEDDSGRMVRFQCPYHAWTYDLEGTLRPPRHTDTLENFSCEAFSLIQVRCETWNGFVFVNLDPAAISLAEHLGEFPTHFNRFPIGDLKRVKQMEYDVRANWKALMENYAECYHCPGVHPLLNHMTPYNLGGYLPGTGEWAGSWMELAGDFETLSTDGSRHGRSEIPGMTTDDLKRVYYAWIWPNLLFSLHPDYLMTHQVWPVSAEESKVICSLYFHPDAIAQPDFDASGPAEFWDLTNRQDWHVCELQQAGTASRAYVPGRYAAIERMVHSFDARVADRYVGDGVRTDVARPAIKEWGSGRTRRVERERHVAD